MSRIAIPTIESSPEPSKPILQAVRQKLGFVPNLYRLIGVSPAALNAIASYQRALSETFDLKTHERIALAVAQVNQCNYGLSAHSYVALNLAKLSPEEVALNREGQSSDTKADAVVRFATSVAKDRGHLSDGDLERARNAGLSNAEIVEIVALVAENIFTNFLNEVAATEIDFPIVDYAQAG